MKSKLLAREYLYFLACILLTLLGWIGIFVWNKYWTKTYKKLDSAYIECDSDYNLISSICDYFPRELPDCNSREGFMEFLSKPQNPSKVHTFLEEYSPYYNADKEFIEKFLNTFPTAITLEVKLESYGGNLEERRFELQEERNNAFSNILPNSEDDLRGWSGFTLFELEPNSLDISSYDKETMIESLIDFQKYYDESESLYVIPHWRSMEFESDFEYAVRKGWKAGDVMTVKKVLFYIFLLSVLLLFGVRYFFRTIVWSVKAVRAK